MNIFEDKKNGITWYNASRDIAGEFKKEDERAGNEFVKEIDTWMSSNICRFLTDEDLGTFMLEDSRGEGLSDMYFGMVDGRLASALVVAKNQGIDIRGLLRHVTSAQRIDIKNETVEESFVPLMSIDDAKKILRENNQGTKSAYLNFVVVNPDMQLNGIGTRSIRSIDENTEYFTGADRVNCIYSTVHKNNTASRSLFRKCGYFGLRTDENTQPYPFDDFYNVK